MTTHVKAPNGNQPEVSEILQAAEREGELTGAERQALFERLQTMYAAGQIEILEGDQTFTLAREPGGLVPRLGPRVWHVVMDWVGAVVVKRAFENKYVFYPLESFPED